MARETCQLGRDGRRWLAFREDLGSGEVLLIGTFRSQKAAEATLRQWGYIPTGGDRWERPTHEAPGPAGYTSWAEAERAVLAAKKSR